MRRREPGLGSQTASLLVLLGFVGVMGFVFVAGVLAGRHWPRLLPSLGASAPRVEAESRRGGPDRGRASQPAPVLSFYQELTAPIGEPPLPPRGRPARQAKPDEPKPDAPNPELPKQETVRPQLPEPAPAPAAAVAPRAPAGATQRERRFTIQVAAFKTRPQAETMRRTLVDGGFDAYVSDTESSNGARYRVRVGTYTSRDDALQTARRLATERRLSTFITAR